MDGEIEVNVWEKDLLLLPSIQFAGSNRRKPCIELFSIQQGSILSKTRNHPNWHQIDRSIDLVNKLTSKYGENKSDSNHVIAF